MIWAQTRRNATAGLSQIRRRQDLCSRSISRRYPTPASRSSPSVINSTIAPWPSTRRDQLRLNSARHWPMRVPPDQSSTAPRHLVERDVDVLVAQIARDVGEPRAEEEGVDAVAVVGHRVHEMQEDAAVAAHRAGNVAEDDQRRRPRAARACASSAIMPAGAQLGAQAWRAYRRGRRADRARSAGSADRRAASAMRRIAFLACVDLLVRHFLEIHLAQHFALGEGHGRVELDLGLAFLRSLPSPSALAAPRRGGDSSPRPFPARAARSSGSIIAIMRSEQLRIAPEDVERLVEQLAAGRGG